MTTPLERLADGQAALIELLTAQQTVNDSLLAAISDLYSKIGGNLDSGIWTWTASTTPGLGEFHIEVLSGNGRRFSVSKTDADGAATPLTGFGPGDSLTLLDDPASPPATGFRQYIATGAPADHGSWLRFDATRTAIFGTQDFPAPGTRIALLFG